MKRNSSIELIKIIAMFMICFSHCLYNVEFIATNNYLKVFSFFVGTFGQLGNILFVITSFYFLISNDTTRKEKIINIILDSFVISVSYLVIFLFLKKNISTKEIIQQFIPIISMNNWFVSCYLIIYIVHGNLNKLIKHMSKRKLLKANIILIVMYSCLSIIFAGGVLFYNYLIGFVTLYFLVSYIYKYMEDFSKNIKLNRILLIISIIMHLSFMFLINYLGLKFNYFSGKIKYYNEITNPVYIVFAISMFNIFKSKKFYSKTINEISSISLIFYITHENKLFRTYVRPDLFSRLNIKCPNLVKSFIFAIIIYLFFIIISIIYKHTIGKLINKASIKLSEFIHKKYLIIENKLLSIK